MRSLKYLNTIRNRAEFILSRPKMKLILKFLIQNYGTFFTLILTDFRRGGIKLLKDIACHAMLIFWTGSDRIFLKPYDFHHFFSLLNISDRDQENQNVRTSRSTSQSSVTFKSLAKDLVCPTRLFSNFQILK